MNQFNFKSQIATSRVQSERLLALGLKKETADMCSVIDHVSDGGKWEEVDTIFSFTPDDWNFRESVTPRWSLHRLIEMMPECLTFYGNLYYISIRERQVKYVMDGVSDGFFGCWGGYTLYDKVINCIEWLIKEGYFPKEYLV